MELNMTKGNPLKLITKFMLPVFLGNLFYQFYNVIDTIIVGRCLGVEALAAVGATGSIIFLVFGFMNGLTTGFTIPIAQAYGEGNIGQMKKYTGNAIILSALVTVLMTILSIAGMGFILNCMNVPPDIYDMSKSYITIICAGMCCSTFYGLLASILRAIGNSKVPLYFIIVAAGTNVLLDFAFILWFGMGVAGAALATVISQFLSGFLCLMYMLRKTTVLAISKEHLMLEFTYSRKQVLLGLPMALQFSITAFGAMLTQTALNTFGTFMVASYIVAGKVEQIVMQPLDSLGVTMATYSAQNWGKYNLERVKKGCKIAVLLAIGYSILAYCAVNPLLPYIVPLFAKENLDVITSYVRSYIMIATSFFIPLGMIFIYRNVLQGCGIALIPMLGGVMELVGRATVSFFAVKYHSFIGVCFANASAWLITGLFLVIAYFVIMKKNRWGETESEAHNKGMELS